jgi:flagellar motor switch protein FliG
METSNLRKAAVLMRSLSEDQVALLLSKLAPEQALAVSAEMAGLCSISPEEQEAVAVAFAEASSAGMELEKNTSNEDKPFQFLWDIEPKELVALLGNEHPQTMALILSQLPTQQAAETISALPPDQQTSVTRRIAAISPPNPEIVDDVEQCLQSLLTGVKDREALGVAGVVKILGAMRPSAERQLLHEIGQTDPDLLREIRQAMFGVDIAAMC